MPADSLNPQPSHPVPRRCFEDDACLVPEVLMAGWTLFPEADASGLTGHSHPGAFELCYLVRGQALWWVEHEILEVEPGDIYITWPGEFHGGLDGAMHPCELYWLQLALPEDAAALDLTVAETAALRAALDGLPARACPGTPTLTTHYERVLRELEAPGPLSPAMIRAAVRLLCSDLLACFAKLPESGRAARTYSPRVHEAIHWFEQHLDQAISVEEAAAAVNLSASYFRTLFREETGFSPIEYLTHLRIREARHRLAETDDDVTRIAFALGFSSSQYFATVFKKQTGLTPTDYRARRQQA